MAKDVDAIKAKISMTLFDLKLKFRWAAYGETVPSSRKGVVEIPRGEVTEPVVSRIVWEFDANGRHNGILWLVPKPEWVCDHPGKDHCKRWRSIRCPDHRPGCAVCHMESYCTLTKSPVYVLHIYFE